MPHSCPGVPERMAWGGYKRPAGARGTSRHEEARHQDQHREQIDPVAQHVHVGKNHVPGAHHQRDQVVPEAPQEQRGEQIDHHDHPVHGDELQVLSGADEGEGAREGQLQPHQPRQHQSHQSNRQRSDRILDGDNFGVLGKDVFRHPALRMVEFYVFDFGGWDRSGCANRDIDHGNALALSDEARSTLSLIVRIVSCPDACPVAQRQVYCVAFACLVRADNCANVFCFCSHA